MRFLLRIFCFDAEGCGVAGMVCLYFLTSCKWPFDLCSPGLSTDCVSLDLPFSATFQETPETPRGALLSGWTLGRLFCCGISATLLQSPLLGTFRSCLPHPSEVPCGTNKPRGTLLSPQDSRQTRRTVPWKNRPFIHKSKEGQTED